MDSDPIPRLDRRWRQGFAGKLVEMHLKRWGEREPALAPFADVSAVLRVLRAGSRHDRDAVLHGLLACAKGDPLAGQLVLEAILPGLKSIAGRLVCDASQLQDISAILLACAWEQVRSYPIEERPRNVAANLLLDTLRRTLKAIKDERRTAVEPAGLRALNLPADAPGPDVEEPLRRAVAAGAITADEAELIARTRIDGADLRALAEKIGVAYHTLNVRRLRAEKRLSLFLGVGAVTSRRRKRPMSCARVAGDGLAGSAGGGDAHPPD